jgi:hypothetical protein
LGHQAAAQIVPVGYPRLVADQPCVTADFDALNQLADYVRDKQKARVAEVSKAGTRVAFADVLVVAGDGRRVSAAPQPRLRQPGQHGVNLRRHHLMAAQPFRTQLGQQ